MMCAHSTRPTGSVGTWSKAGDAVRVDPSSGVAVAVLPGTALLVHDISSKLSSSLQVECFVCLSAGWSHCMRVTELVKVAAVRNLIVLLSDRFVIIQ